MPHQNYIELDKERLMRLHEGLELLEQVDRQAVAGMDLRIYGITSNEQVLDSAREAIADEAGVAEQDVQITEVAIAIPISSDTIYALTGSGIRLSNEEFAYASPNGRKGVAEMSFTFASYKPTVNANAFSKMALGASSGWVADFLQREGNKQPVQITPNVHRTEEATQPGVPPAPAIPKQTSLDEKFFDRFLD